MQSRRIARRKLLAASVAAGAVWTTPVVLEVSTAGAAVLSHPAEQCPVVRPDPAPTRGTNPFGAITFDTSVETVGGTDPVERLSVAVRWEHGIEYLFERRVLCCGSTSHADSIETAVISGGPATAMTMTTTYAQMSGCSPPVGDLIVRHVLVPALENTTTIGSATLDVLVELDSGGAITVIGASNPVSTFYWLVYPLAP
jgi:hypothetical protein